MMNSIIPLNRETMFRYKYLGHEGAIFLSKASMYIAYVNIEDITIFLECESMEGLGMKIMELVDHPNTHGGGLS